jgi:hypothetical protein
MTNLEMAPKKKHVTKQANPTWLISRDPQAQAPPFWRTSSRFPKLFIVLNILEFLGVSRFLDV